MQSFEEELKDHPQIKRLTSSPGYSALWKSIAKRPLRRSAPVALMHEAGLWWAVLNFLEGPTPVEKLTGTARKKVAADIGRASRVLTGAWKKIAPEGKSLPFAFQTLFDSLAVDAARHFLEPSPFDEEEYEDAHNAYRNAVNDFLNSGLSSLFEVLAEAADMLAEGGKTMLPMPNDKNALRLYFIRRLTDYFYRTFEKLLRKETLQITSVFFDCGDIDERCLSDLAPDPSKKKHGYAFSQPIVYFSKNA